MSRTFTSLHYHIVFGTKNREPLLHASWRERLFEYLGGTVNGLGGFIQGCGGVADHVHMLVGLKATHCLSDVVREIKKATNAWITDEMHVKGFAWQEGYAAFTVSASSRPGVKRYIGDQESHHRKKSFREELMHMLRLAEVDFDDDYVG